MVRTARSRSSTPAWTPRRLRSEGGWRRASTCSRAAWVTRTWRPTSTRPTTGGTGGGGGGTNVLANGLHGHGTPVAGVIAQFVPQATLVPVNIFLPFSAGKRLTASSTPAAPAAAAAEEAVPAVARAALGTSNALTSSDLLYNGLQYVVQHPFVNDPLRPGKVDRVIAASFAFGSTQTFETEVDAYNNYPQVVIALKNAYHKFLKEGIAPIAASGQFGDAAGGRSPDEQLDDGADGGANTIPRARTMPTTARLATSTGCRFRRFSTR